MSKKKQKQNALQPQNNLAAWLKKYWWIVMTGALIVSVPIFLSVKPSLDARVTQERFSSGYEQILSFYRTIQSSALWSSNSDSIVKRCSRIYHGFTVSTECGTYARIVLPSDYQADTQAKIESAMSDTGFTDIMISTSEGSGAVEASTESGLVCIGGWRTSDPQGSGLLFTLFCRGEAPQYLDGYEVID